MNNKVIAVSGLVLVLIAVVATACMLTFNDGIRKLDWIDLEMAALGSGAIGLLGCILGWCAMRTAPGKAAAIIGTILVLLYAYQFVRTETRSTEADPNPPPRMNINAEAD